MYRIIVSGTSRSGTSMMMRMLEKGGIPAVHDDGKRNDANPNGFYEYSKVATMNGGKYAEFLNDLEGKCLKVLSSRLIDLPKNYNYKIIFMVRFPQEIKASLHQLAKIDGITEELNLLPDSVYTQHYIDMRKWINIQSNMQSLFVLYNSVISHPNFSVDRIINFLDLPLDRNNMLSSIDPLLYRNKCR